MGFGLPCPPEHDPAKVFTLVEEFDAIIEAIVQDVIARLQTSLVDMAGQLGPTTEALKNCTRNALLRINRAIGDVFDLLRSQLTSQDFVVNATLSSTITEIAELLRITNDEVISGPVPITVPGSPFPGTTRPFAPPRPITVAPVFPPGTQPYPMPPNVLPPPAQAPPSSLVRDGMPEPVARLVDPITNGQSVLVNGFAYAPTYTLYLTQGQLRVDENGNPVVSMSFDAQSDGSVSVNIGPVSVVISLTPQDPNAPPASCNPEASPFGV